MVSLEQVLKTYAEYHQNKINRYTHYVGIPLIVFGCLIFFSWFNFSINPIMSFSLMWVIVIFTCIYYLILDIQLGIITNMVLFILATFAGLVTDYQLSKHSIFVFMIAFLGGWVLQFIGHYFENRRPAFFGNFRQIFSAPLFLTAEILVKLGKRSDLRHMLRKTPDLLDQDSWDR